MLSVIEATLDDPRQVLSAQQFKARGEAVAAMKAEGIEYEERMELLEDVTYPKPLAELLDAAYEMYRRGHPWVADHELAPKSVVRDMYERAMTFAEYVGFYGLARSEGLVLRYLADAYKALRQTVPEDAKTEELIDLIEWLGELVRQVDSSLLDEWERLRNPTRRAELADRCTRRRPRRRRSPRNVRAFRVLVRNALFRRVELAALRRYDDARRARRRGRLGRRRVGRRRWSRTSTSTTRSAPGRTPAGRRCCMIDEEPEPLDGPADLRRPGRRPRLGHQRRGRPRRLRRGRRGRRPGHRRRPALAGVSRGGRPYAGRPLCRVFRTPSFAGRCQTRRLECMY